MKIQLVVFLLLFLSSTIYGQKSISMDAAIQRQEISMAEVTGKTSDGLYRYYAKGESTPYTGVLYSKFPNGQFDSWQEYVDGVGQGKWINYYENGNYKEIGHYEQNRVEGEIQKFHENGKLAAKGTYKEWRIRIGKWEYYDENGTLTHTEDYGKKGNIDEVQAYYDRGDIPYSWYSKILSDNGFKL